MRIAFERKSSDLIVTTGDFVFLCGTEHHSIWGHALLGVNSNLISY